MAPVVSCVKLTVVLAFTLLYISCVLAVNKQAPDSEKDVKIAEKDATIAAMTAANNEANIAACETTIVNEKDNKIVRARKVNALKDIAPHTLTHFAGESRHRLARRIGDVADENR